MKPKLWRVAILASLMAVTGTAQAHQSLSELLGGPPVLKGKKLMQAIKAAAAHPLGSEQNPVRANMPTGQRAYLSRLRCSNGKAPEYERAGSLGPGIYGNMIDAYRVTCVGGDPADTIVIMDMYHAHVEEQAIAGFSIQPAA